MQAAPRHARGGGGDELQSHQAINKTSALSSRVLANDWMFNQSSRKNIPGKATHIGG
jgi:hypothetical protein